MSALQKPPVAGFPSMLAVFNTDAPSSCRVVSIVGAETRLSGSVLLNAN
ncbi:MAG: hypothetical protein M3R15_03525 [Acidobacteriota bacterium]|nr:hypothetical protein [Acidobacteriota bacterium]